MNETTPQEKTSPQTSTPRSVRKTRAVWLVCQIAIVEVVALLLILGVGKASPGPSVTGGIAFSLLIFVCSSIGIWGGLGYWPWRWIPFALVALGIGFFACFAFGHNGPEFHIFCLSIIAVVLLTSMALRFWKGQLQFIAVDDDRQDALQFGIKHIFVWTTAIAILLGGWQLVYPTLIDANVFVNSRWLLLLSIAGLGSMISLSVLVNIWAMLGQRVTLFKLIVLIGVTNGAGYFNNLIMPGGSFFLYCTIGSQTLVTLALIGLRWNDLRFVK